MRRSILARIAGTPVAPLPAALLRAAGPLPGADPVRSREALAGVPGLADAVLRLDEQVRSARCRPAADLPDLVRLRGADKALALALAAVTACLLKPGLPGYGLAPCELLSHSAVVALAALRLAEEAHVGAPAHTFLAGLLSGLGKTVLDPFLRERGREVLRLAEDQGLPFGEAERMVLGMDQAEAGAALAGRLGLPDCVVEILRYRLEPEKAPGEDQALHLVHAGDMLAKMSGIGIGLDGLRYRLSPLSAERLGLNQACLNKTLAHVTTTSDGIVREILLAEACESMDRAISL